MRSALRWGGEGDAPLRHPLHGVPWSVVIECNRAEFSAGDVRYAAEQACLAFNAQAVPQRDGTRGGLRVMEFICSAPLIALEPALFAGRMLAHLNR